MKCKTCYSFNRIYKVDQVSKSIADISTGRLLFHDKMDTVTDWLTAVNLNSTSLVKRSAWSVLRLNDKSRAMMPPTDVKHDFLSVDQNAKLEGNIFFYLICTYIFFSGLTGERFSNFRFHFCNVSVFGAQVKG